MGFLSKIWKGVKKTVKKIGKGIKSAFKKFGKVMGKVGILGQVAMMFVLPGIGAALGGAFTGAAGALASNTVGGALGAIGQTAGKVMQFVGNAVSTAGNTFSNITKGVTETLGNFAKTATNKLAGKVGMENVFSDAAANFFGPGDSAFSRSFGKDVLTEAIPTSGQFSRQSIDSLESTKPQMSPIETTKTGESLLSKDPKAAKSFATKKLEEGVDRAVKTVGTGLGQHLSDTVPKPPVQNVYNAGSINFDTASIDDYGAPVIMNARDFERQVTNNPDPYAYTAFQYGNYMANVG